LDEAVGKLAPETFLALDDTALRRIGLSRQKMSYGRVLAQAVASGALRFKPLNRLDDEDVIAELTKLKGIGRWTAESYLLSALKRADVWPADDLALIIAVQHLKGLKERPDRKTMLEIGDAWRPWRSAAARLIWRYYRNSVEDRA
jgi:DNA-3-methyladenine glycosylase II